ncbi:hypothetical protein OG481_09650 [Streptomyces longwoodensis]|uniref:hypothetical protein n=1 Tax=Streptomyces longwoodensis TaxID=68231 RepID=UPI002DDA74C0|nr:hypothetical protein [Streptomyces longwoodensis]WRY88780.1 hypothetical protein OG481_09650 [Streptomyces longwoodensis]
MELIEETYFGWNPLSHAPGCERPVWDDAQVLHTAGVRPGTYGAEHHDCSHADCSHGDRFERVQLRLLCRTCGTVCTISGESLMQVISHTAATGWGQAPLELGGVWLWPGRPAIEGGEPYQYLVTRDASRTVSRDTLYGIISGYFNASGTKLWVAGARPDPDGAHQISTLRWRHASPGYEDLAAAAAWIADVETAPQRPLVVAV